MPSHRVTPRHSLGALAFLLAAGRAVPAQRASAASPPPSATTTAHPATPDAAFDSARYGAMRWRNIGPFRGGRATAVTGVPSQPLVYYAGYAGGGVWKTDDAGASWRNVSDGYLRMGSIGAIAVADDDPNVVYVGTGEAPVRGQSSSWGDGVYKSTDAGRTWSHVGLERVRQISRVVVHPTNDDIVYVAAQGSRWSPTADRGIYRSTDGGKHWTLLLHPSDSAGASDLSMDPTNPRILYAAFWHLQRVPWQVRSGGSTGGIWKSVDGGDSWTKLGGGLPNGIVGKIGVAVSPAQADRVYAIVEADSGGLYRSDDAGKTWRRTSDDHAIRARAWYYTNVIADPKSADVVYVMNAPIMKSIDGGKTFAVLPAKHGDNHALWINPRDDAYMINASDGGAIVTLNGGRTWSTQDNQPTAQFYRVATDARFPYRVYGAQQDNTTVVIASRSPNEGIGATDWHDVGGCESAHIAFDPKHPRYVYAGCYQGMITEYDDDTRLARNVMAWPALGLAEPSSEQRYRFNWSAPIALSPQDPSVIYHGGNVLFRSADRGQTWTPISPDLTRNEKSTQGLGGAPITNEGAGGEVYNTIYYIAPSPHDAKTIWVGTDDGLVQLTRDGGATWTRVTPANLPPGQINMIEPSPHDAATAYVVVYRAKWNDNAPYIYRTTDYGRSWTKIVAGLPPDETVRVVREGRLRRGLLYAGTETGVYISLDGGARWTSFQSNLPHVPVTDLQISGGDLVASTEGRAFWILDDLAPMPQYVDTTRATRLFAPRPAYRSDWGPAAEAGSLGSNPPPGATLYYWLAAAPDSAGVTLDVLDASGAVIRHFASRAAPPTPVKLAVDDKPITAKAGLNRVAWDLRATSVVRPAGLFFASPTSGYRVPPGTYTVRLTVAGAQYTQPLEVRSDPRLQLTADQQREEERIIVQLHARANEIFRNVLELRDVRDQVKRIVDRVDALPNADAVRRAGAALLARTDTLENSLVQTRTQNGQDIINFRNGLVDQYLFLADAVDAADAPVTAGMTARLAELDAQWQRTNGRVRAALDADLAAFNALLSGAPAVIRRK